MDKEYLQNQILDFLDVLLDCWSGTVHSQDRPIYANDIAVASKWLVELHRGASVANVGSEIIHPQTDKTFTDYWRQGHWGEQEANALKHLQGIVRNQIKN